MKLPSRRTAGGGTSYRLPLALCPSCGRAWDGAGVTSGETAQQPRPGDLTVCIACAGVAQFDAGLRLVAFPAERLGELTPEEAEDVRRKRLAVVLAIAMTGYVPPGIKGGRA